MSVRVPSPDGSGLPTDAGACVALSRRRPTEADGRWYKSGVGSADMQRTAGKAANEKAAQIYAQSSVNKNC